MKILDIHTHHAVPQPEGVVSLRFNGETYILTRSQAYSIGIHPWDSRTEFQEKDWELMMELAARPEIVAIGEAGVDLAGKGGALFRQLNIFKRQIELSEELQKPLIIHDVKAHDIIIGLRRDLKPKQNWVIHGLRGKKEVAQMLLKAGCYVSYGEQFNRDALLSTPEELILAETDESALDINEIIDKISLTMDKDMKEVIAENTRRFLEG